MKDKERYYLKGYRNKYLIEPKVTQYLRQPLEAQHQEVKN